jgi:hypothetical protein
MSLQINVPLTTNQGFTVSSGSYVWIHEERSTDRKYSIVAIPRFYKDKASFDAGLAPFTPNGLPVNMQSFYQEFTPANYGAVTSLTVQTYVRDQLTQLVGPGNVVLVQ